MQHDHRIPHLINERTTLLVHKPSYDLTETHSTVAEEKSVIRKLDRRILPLTAILYLSAYLDRGNLGNARLQGLQSEILDGSDKKFSIVLCSFFVTYVLLSIPGTLLAKAISPSTAISIGALIWASATCLTAACNNYSSLIFCRLMIGVGEALFGQSVALYYSMWYKKNEIGSRLAMFIGAGVTAGGFGGLIAYAVSMLGHNSWRILFLIEGLPSLAIAVAILFWLPSRPDRSRFLTTSERAVVLHRLEEDGVYESGSGIDWSGVQRALSDWKSYVIAILYSCMNLTLGSVSGFLPSIIASMGHEGPIAQLYTIPPYFVAFIVMTSVSIASDRYQSRAGAIAGVFSISSLGWIILLAVENNNHLRYFATFLVVIGGYCAIPLILGWVSNNTGSESQRATSLGLLNSVGQMLAIASAFIFPASGWKLGFSLNLIANLIAILIALSMRAYYRAENRRRDLSRGQTYGKHDLALGFRYVY